MPDEALKDGATAGRSLKRIFRQDDFLRRVHVQPAESSLLMNRTRMAVFIHLYACPGDHVRSVARKAGVNLNSAKLHLDRLESAGYIDSATLFGRKGFFPKGMVKAGDMGMVMTLRHGWALNLVKLAGERRGGRQADFARSAGASQQLTDSRLRRLESVGLVRKEGKGRAARYFVGTSVPGKYLAYAGSAKRVARDTASLLGRDGLSPFGARVRGTRLSVTVHTPGAKSTLHLECNPLACLRFLDRP